MPSSPRAVWRSASSRAARRLQAPAHRGPSSRFATDRIEGGHRDDDDKVTYTLGHQPALATGANTFVADVLAGAPPSSSARPRHARRPRLVTERRVDVSRSRGRRFGARQAVRRLHHADARRWRARAAGAVRRLQRRLPGDRRAHADASRAAVARQGRRHQPGQSAERRGLHAGRRRPTVSSSSTSITRSGG